MALVDQSGSENNYVGVTDIRREKLASHPWSLEGGEAPEILELIDRPEKNRLVSEIVECGFTAITGEDDFFVLPRHIVSKLEVKEIEKKFVEGDRIRDWGIDSNEEVLFTPSLSDLKYCNRFYGFSWPYRTKLSKGLYFGKRKIERGIRWFDFVYWSDSKLQGVRIAFAFVATHNHFVLDRGGRVFKQSAPVIKLAPNATEEDHLGLIGPLNSSTACFWMKQKFYNKGQGEQVWADRYEHDSTKNLSINNVHFKRTLAKRDDSCGQVI